MRQSPASESAPPSGVVHIDHEAVAKAFKSGSPLLVTNNFKVQTGNRTQPGEVEVHESDTDIFYILEGTATFVTGGTALEPRVTGEGESRAKQIVGGHAQSLSKGDVIVIPAGVAHQNISASDDFGVVGAYPDGREWDLLRGRSGERPVSPALRGSQHRDKRTWPVPESGR